MVREKLKEMLKKLHEAKPEELEKVKNEAAKYFKGVEPKEFALAEQELVHEGVGRREMRRLCDVHLEVMKEQLGAKAKKIKLPLSHPITILMDEHKVIKENLKKLQKTAEKLKATGSFEKAKKAIDTLKELSHFLLETEKHYQREEEGIFPRLIEHGIIEPPAIFKEDHVEFKAKKKLLAGLAMVAEEMVFKDLLDKVTPIVEFLSKNLNDHIFKEENILYPMSLATLGKYEWIDVRKKFDVIGYCCFTPADLQKKTKRGKK